MPPKRSPRRSPKRSPKRSHKRSPKRSSRRSPKRSSRRSPKRSSKRSSRRSSKRSPRRSSKRSPRRKSRLKSRRKSRRKSIRKNTMDCVYDAKCATQNYGGKNLKITVRKGPKGMSLFAVKPIKKGNIIANYKFKLYKYTDNYVGKKDDMYTMSVYTKKDNFNSRVIGDVFEGSLEAPKRNIPFWAYFSNEPSGKQRSNAELDVNLEHNYKNRRNVKPGDTMIYRLRATRNIKPGEEIVWCYGETYGERPYQANC